MSISRHLPYGEIMPGWNKRKHQLFSSTGKMIEQTPNEPTTKEQLRMRQIELFDSTQTQIIENLQKKILELSENGRDAGEILNLTLAVKEHISIIESSNGIYPMYSLGETDGFLQ